MRVLLVAATTGYQTRAFSEVAQRIGFELVLATDRCHVLDDPWGDNAVAWRFDAPDKAIDGVDEIGSAAARRKLRDAVFTGAAEAGPGDPIWERREISVPAITGLFGNC